MDTGNKQIKSKIICIIGPTASGKTDLSIKLAKKLNGEIISADSRQVYKGMDIGTAKIIKKEMRGVPHHMIDVVSPKTNFDAVKFKDKAQRIIKDMIKRGKLPIIVGGTGFWIDTLVHDMDFPGTKQDSKLRKQLESKTVEQLFKQLQELDSDRALSIERYNKRRLVRALEIVLTTGKPVPQIKKTSKYDVLWLGIKMDQEQLNRRIKKRFIKWLDKGLIDEVKRLHKSGVSWKRFEELGLAYKYIADMLRNKISHTEMINLSVQSIIKYSKRQMTWFKRNKEIIWID
ncbi:MAG: tRNA (adenosine(37)-N6)-dimethylallyltransferase MiaA [Parcubacteria group bacterium]